MARFAANIQSYDDALAFLGNRDSRKLAHNTYVERYQDHPAHVIGVRLHRTVIVQFYRDIGHVRLNTGGWSSVTTKQRINALLPFGLGLVQRKYAWFIWDRVNQTETPFHDGIVVREPYSGYRITTATISKVRNA